MGKSAFIALGARISLILGTSCVPLGTDQEAVQELSSGLTQEQRIVSCQNDPRVLAGLVTTSICVGADVFFRETFNGNGRTCTSCHPANNNFTLDTPFIASLPAGDPLFVFEQDPALASLEAPELRQHGLIVENVDGTEDLTNKFTLRSVPHTLSLATSLAPDPADGTATPPVQRTGWSGDGAPGSGSLREFLTGAIQQHFPTDLSRTAGTSFRLPSEAELDAALDFQLGLGRLNELNLETVAITDAMAEEGRLAFLDPMRGRCNLCHRNGGANDQGSALNRNSDTGSRKIALTASIGRFDGGFGGRGLASPNIDVLGSGSLTGFGDGTFNPPPLIEAADTAPFFHTNAIATLEDAVAFYNTDAFRLSPSGQELEGVFGAPVAITQPDIVKIARFLSVLNIAFNLDLAKQRLDATLELVNRFHATGAPVQSGLLDLALVEMDDALEVFEAASANAPPLLLAAQVALRLAKRETKAARQAASWQTRRNRVAIAIASLRAARGRLGTNIVYQLGTGNLMF